MPDENCVHCIRIFNLNRALRSVALLQLFKCKFMGKLHFRPRNEAMAVIRPVNMKTIGLIIRVSYRLPRLPSLTRWDSHIVWIICCAKDGQAIRSSGLLLKPERLGRYANYRPVAFAQLTYRESLREIETCLRALGGKLYHCGVRGNISPNNSKVLIRHGHLCIIRMSRIFEVGGVSYCVLRITYLGVGFLVFDLLFLGVVTATSTSFAGTTKKSQIFQSFC